MDKTERLRLELAADRADTWGKQYRKAMADRDALRVAAAVALGKLRAGIVFVEAGGDKYAVLPLGAAHLEPLGALARHVSLPPVSNDDAELLGQLESEIPAAVRDAQPAIAGRGAARKGKDDDDAAADAAEFLLEYVPWGLAEGVEAALERVAVPESALPPAATPPSFSAALAAARGGSATQSPASPSSSNISLADALAPQHGLAGAMRPFGVPELLPATAIRNALAAFTNAERFAELARAVGPSHEYVVVCAPPGRTSADLVTALG